MKQTRRGWLGSILAIPAAIVGCKVVPKLVVPPMAKMPGSLYGSGIYYQRAALDQLWKKFNYSQVVVGKPFAANKGLTIKMHRYKDLT